MLRRVRDWMFYKLANFSVRSNFKSENGLSKLSNNFHNKKTAYASFGRAHLSWNTKNH